MRKPLNDENANEMNTQKKPGVPRMMKRPMTAKPSFHSVPNKKKMQGKKSDPVSRY